MALLKPSLVGIRNNTIRGHNGPSTTLRNLGQDAAPVVSSLIISCDGKINRRSPGPAVHRRRPPALDTTPIAKSGRKRNGCPGTSETLKLLFARPEPNGRCRPMPVIRWPKCDPPPPDLRHRCAPPFLSPFLPITGQAAPAGSGRTQGCLGRAFCGTGDAFSYQRCTVTF